MKPYPMKRIQFERSQLPVTEFDLTSNLIKFSVHVADMADNAIVDAILQAAKEENLTDLYLIDRKFILRALRNELERKRGKWETTMVAPTGVLVRWTHVCKECGYLYTDLRTQGHNFCPNCGADMREG